MWLQRHAEGLDRRGPVMTSASNGLLACTLNTDSLTARLARISLLAERYFLSERQDGPTLRLRYAPKAAAELRDIVAQESQCCPFLTFDLNEAAAHVELAITAPQASADSAALLHKHFRGAASLAPARGCAGSGCGCAA